MEKRLPSQVKDTWYDNEADAKSDDSQCIATENVCMNDERQRVNDAKHA